MFANLTWMIAVTTAVLFTKFNFLPIINKNRCPAFWWGGGIGYICSETLVGRRRATYVPRFACGDHLTGRHLTLPSREVTWKTRCKHNFGRGPLKCDGTRAETIFFFRRNGRVHLNRRGASVQSTTDSRDVRISGSNAGYTMFRGSVKSTGYTLHSPVPPSLPLPCVTVCHHISTGVYCSAAHWRWNYFCIAVLGDG